MKKRACTYIPFETCTTLGVETFAWRNFRAFRGFELDTRKFFHAKFSYWVHPRKFIHAKCTKFRAFLFPRKFLHAKVSTPKVLNTLFLLSPNDVLTVSLKDLKINLSLNPAMTEFVCKLCNDILKRPLALSCNHSFCIYSI